jgi:VCBS repeat-containing protein
LVQKDNSIKIEQKKETDNKKSTQQSKKTVKKIAIKGISKQIAAGKSIKLTASISPKNAKNKIVTWKTSNKKVATVNKNGVVKINKRAAGKTVTITAIAKDGSNKKATYKIKVMKGSVKSISIKGKKTVKAGKTLKLTAKVKASKGANKKLIWKSSNRKYATVSSSGKVKTKKTGKKKTVKITVMSTDGTNKKKTVKIKIK